MDTLLSTLLVAADGRLLWVQTWKARSELSGLRDVLQWHETRGALTLEEEKVLRNSLENPKRGSQ